jgi:hypothetical protein
MLVLFVESARGPPKRRNAHHHLRGSVPAVDLTVHTARRRGRLLDQLRRAGEHKNKFVAGGVFELWTDLAVRHRAARRNL